tara:strand:+ start:4709 stop:5134 length:426 start_codon:yes stop_codon:yes gene_type:complete
MEIHGGCHCGNLRYRLDWPDDSEEIPRRQCSCSFCVKHVGSWTSHRDARLTVNARCPDLLSKYQFGTNTANFLVCARCGVIPIAVSEIDGAHYAVVNVNSFDEPSQYRFSSSATDFDGEDTGSRLARRKRNWIPNVKMVVA